MAAAASFLLVVGLSLLVTRVAEVALVHTGMSRDAARFQARSAFTGVGFTTSEAELVTGHPVRRRLVSGLMLLGSLGVVTAVTSLVLSFATASDGAGGRLLALGIGLLVLAWSATSAWVDTRICTVISWALKRWTSIDARDYARLLHVRDDYGVCELAVDPDDWIAGRTLASWTAEAEGVLVLGIECPGNHFIGAPPADTALRAGDRLILYGRSARIAEIDRRRRGEAGDATHRDAVAERAAIAVRERRAAGRPATGERDA